MGLPGRGHILSDGRTVKIEDHLEQHKDIIEAVAWRYADNLNDFEDAYQ
jgi:hypothetical protein